MKHPLRMAAALAAALALGTAACGSSSTTNAGSSTTSAGSTAAGAATTGGSGTTTASGSGASASGGKVGFILPDSRSSARWEDFDRPLITKACEAAKITCDIQNAEGNASNMSTIADQMIANKVQVLAIVNLDSESGATIQKKAADAGIKNIDYDRLTLGGAANAYVSFDNVAVGTAQGQGIIQCLGGAGSVSGKRIIQLHGSPTDNNATLFKQGYQKAIDGAGLVTVGEEAVPNWDNEQGGAIFQQLLTAAGNKIDGVLVANDGLSLAAQAKLADAGLTGVKTTGQDATVDGLRAILQDAQCMTVYKPIKLEAQGAVDASVALLKGAKPDAKVTINNKTADIPYVQAAVIPIFKDQVKDVVKDGFVTRDKLCKDIDAKCTAAGV